MNTLNTKRVSGEIPEYPSHNKPRLPLRYVAARLAIAGAIGFSIPGAASAIDAYSSLASYVQSPSEICKASVTIDMAYYICSSIALSIVSYIVLRKLFATANGSQSLIQRSRLAKLTSIAICGAWVSVCGRRQELVIVYIFANAADMGFWERLLALAMIMKMGEGWYRGAASAFGPPQHQPSPAQSTETTRDVEKQPA